MTAIVPIIILGISMKLYMQLNPNFKKPNYILFS